MNVYCSKIFQKVLQGYKILSPLLSKNGMNKAEVNSNSSGSLCGITVDGW